MVFYISSFSNYLTLVATCISSFSLYLPCLSCFYEVLLQCSLTDQYFSYCKCFYWILERWLCDSEQNQFHHIYLTEGDATLKYLLCLEVMAVSLHEASSQVFLNVTVGVA